MRIHFILTEDYVFHPIYFENIVRAFPEEIISVSILYDDGREEKKIQNFFKDLSIYGFKGSFLLGVQRIFLLFLNLYGKKYRGHYCSIRSFAKAMNICFSEPKRVNDITHLKWIKKKNPELIISSCGQIFGKQLLKIPKIACINRHTSPLPRYRGAMPVIHMLANGENKLGVTIHTMESTIDAGKIIAQALYDINEKDTLYSSYRKGFHNSIKVTREAIQLLKKFKPDIFPDNEISKGNYFGNPTRYEGRAVRKKRRIVCLYDILTRF